MARRFSPAGGRGLVVPLLALVLLAPVTGLRAQRPGAPVDAVGSAWASGDASALAALMASSVRLHIHGDDHVGVSPRQVGASLGRLFDRFGTAPASLLREGVLADDRARAYAEFRWAPVARGGAEALDQTVYVGFRRDAERWQIVELRVLR